MNHFKNILPFRKSVSSLILILIIFFFSAGAISAHTITLKNGKVIVGKIVNQTKTDIQIMVNGSMVTVLKSDVSEVDYSSAQPAPVKKPEPVKKTEPEKKPEPVKKEKKFNLFKKEKTPEEPGNKEPAKIEAKEPKEEETTPEEKPARPLNEWDLTWRSALVPGWGQYKVNKKIWAYTEGPFAYVAFFYSLNERTRAIKEKKKYEESATNSAVLIFSTIQPGTNTIDSLLKQYILQAGAFNVYQKQVAKYNNSLLYLGIAYMGQLSHAFYLGWKNKRSENPVTAFHFGMMPVQNENGSPGISSYAAFTFRF